MTLVSGAGSFRVPNRRVNKALVALDPDEILLALSKATTRTGCRCSRKCYANFTLEDFTRERLAYLKHPNEASATNYLASQIIVAREESVCARYYVNARQVCGSFYALLMHCSRTKVYKARELAFDGGRVEEGTQVKMPYETRARMRTKCVSFWRIYYDALCQRVSDDVRLRPSNLVVRSLYDGEFQAFIKKFDPDSPTPSFTTFKRAMK